MIYLNSKVTYHGLLKTLRTFAWKERNIRKCSRVASR